MSKILFIDTRERDLIKLKLDINGKIYEKVSSGSFLKSQAVLPLLQKLLKQAGLNPKDLTQVMVETKGSSLTGVRVGIAIANTLGFSLKIPVNGKKVGHLVQARYNEYKYKK